MNDIISTVQNMKSNMTVVVDIVVALVSFLASILAIIGKTLPGILIKLKNWKDRKAIRYSILNPINRSENNEVMVIKLLIEFAKMIIPIIILLMTTNICLFWLNYNGFEDNMKAYLLILIGINTCILCEFIETKKQSKIYRIPFEIVDVILLDFVILKNVVEYGIRHGVDIMIVLMTIICVCNFIIIELIFILNRYDNINRSRGSVLIKGVRLFCGLVYIVVLFYFTTSESLAMYGKIATVFFGIVWLVLCYIEAKINNSIKVDFKIDTGQDVEVTQKTIYQYECDKVKYILTNGCTKIINSDEIQSISYTIKNTIWDTIRNVSGRSRMANVTCLLENNDVLNFDGYNFTKDLWVSFYKLNGNKREVKIINSKIIKKIIVKEVRNK